MLLHCPFCAERKALSIARIEFDDPFYFVFCQICGVAGPQSDTPEDAEFRWNERADDDTIVETQSVYAS